MMQFYFIRHAQSSNNALYDQTGSSRGRSHDPEVTKLGLEQARMLGEYLASGHPDVNGIQAMRNNFHGYGLTHLYTSLMQRAVTTASIVAERLNLPLDAWVDVHETGGIYLEDETTGAINGLPGFSRAELQQRYPHLRLPDARFDNGWWLGGMETQEEMNARVQRFLAELLRRHGDSDDRVAIVSHGAFYNLFLSTVLRLPSDAQIWFRINNVAITRIDFMDEEIALCYTNRCHFLDAALIT